MAAARAAIRRPGPAKFVPTPKTNRGPAGQLLDHRAAEHMFHDDVRVADLLRRRDAAFFAIAVHIKHAALLLALGDSFTHAPGDTLPAIVAERRDREQFLL